MKKILSFMLSLIMLTAVLSVSAFAADADSAEVLVTIADGEGKLALALEKITVTDIDSDGKLTINDALYCAHEAKFEGGAAVGYASASSDWGLSLTKLWGVENGGSYGYYVNNALAMGLTDPVKDGDLINAFVYTDLTAWSDKYCYFDMATASVTAGDELTLTLKAIGYDDNFNTVELPVANATITLDGESTEYKTDADGKVTVKLDTTGAFIVSATDASERLVPPALSLTVTAAEADIPDTGDSQLICIIAVIALAAVGAIALVCVTFGKNREN